MLVFLDTNIYLSFYDFSNETLEELKKLVVLVKSQQIELIITEQVTNEFRRNREETIAKVVKMVQDAKIPNQYPTLCKEYKEYKQIREIIVAHEALRHDLLRQLNEDILNERLGADEIINELIELSRPIKTTADFYNLAKMRIDLGNPPGKNGSLGDAVNWETLLSLPDIKDLYLITADGDFFSHIDKNKGADFLKQEWCNKKVLSSLYFYKSLSKFFNDKFPQIQLATDLEKELAVDQLVKSGSFVTTHAAIATLSKFSNFSYDQKNAILGALISNDQVHWILTDEDVNSFYRKFIVSNRSGVDPILLAEAEQHLRMADDEMSKSL